jgi:DNA-binding HxlR family transcriptional regulator
VRYRDGLNITARLGVPVIPVSSEQSAPIDRLETDHDHSVARFTDVEPTLLSMQEIVGRKWQPIIVHHLLVTGPSGFSSLKGGIDRISSKMLSESLDDLERAGLVDRTLLSDQPVRVEYSLTDRGLSLEPLIEELLQWGTVHDVADTGGSAAEDDAGHTTQISMEGSR